MSEQVVSHFEKKQSDKNRVIVLQGKQADEIQAHLRPRLHYWNRKVEQLFNKQHY